MYVASKGSEDVITVSSGEEEVGCSGAVSKSHVHDRKAEEKIHRITRVLFKNCRYRIAMQ